MWVLRELTGEGGNIDPRHGNRGCGRGFVRRGAAACGRTGIGASLRDGRVSYNETGNRKKKMLLQLFGQRFGCMPCSAGLLQPAKAGALPSPSCPSSNLVLECRVGRRGLNTIPRHTRGRAPGGRRAAVQARQGRCLAGRPDGLTRLAAVEGSGRACGFGSNKTRRKGFNKL